MKTVLAILSLLWIYLVTKHYIIHVFLIWTIIETIIFSIKKRNYKILVNFICNFVLTIFNCIDILFNILLQVPANRILLITTKTKTIFGNPKESFTYVLRVNFVFNNLKNRGLLLYKIILSFKKVLHRHE